jgi:hypothetical protein
LAASLTDISSRARTALAERLRDRRGEIAEAAWNRVLSIEAPPAGVDHGYLDGLRNAVVGAIDYGIDAAEQGCIPGNDVPAVLRSQARLAARSGVSLDTVLRRYLTGYTLFSEFVLQEAITVEPALPPDELGRVVRFPTALLDHIMTTVGEEYARGEHDRQERRRTDPRMECVEKLLAGELIDTSVLNYDLDAFHLGLVASGGQAEEKLRAMARTVGAQALSIARDGLVWVWLGGREPVDPSRLEGRDVQSHLKGLSLGIGETGGGREGWRLTHRQADATWPIVLSTDAERLRYADVALVSAARRDSVLAASLRSMYLRPLEVAQDGGESIKQTLRAYLGASGNVSSAAAALGLSRQTVLHRLRSSEERIGRRLDDCAADLDVALKLDAIEGT